MPREHEMARDEINTALTAPCPLCGATVNEWCRPHHMQYQPHATRLANAIAQREAARGTP